MAMHCEWMDWKEEDESRDARCDMDDWNYVEIMRRDGWLADWQNGWWIDE